jgi:phosphotriesterase-related protein
MHEHIAILNPEIEQNYPGHWDEAAEAPRAAGKLRELREQGVGTLVDLTVIGLGRDVGLVRRLAGASGLHVIVATGAYYFDELPAFFRNRGPGSIHGGPEILDELFVRDIEKGIADTGIRAGILKCACDARGVTPDVGRVLRAVAHAHRQTGVPISTHTDAGRRRGLDLQAVFREEGVDLSRVVVGHSGDSTDIGYLTTMMDAGSYIGMDRFGLDHFLPTRDRVDTIAELVRRGYAGRMVLSHDTSCYSMNYDNATRAQKLPDWRYTFLLDTVVPMLRQRGVSQEDVNQMLIANPRDIFSRSGGY